MIDITIELDTHSKTPLYEQIYEYIKEDIRAGRLVRGIKLPSGRRLSTYLEVSRSTVLLAYEQLLSEGYIESRPGSGYYVADIEGLYQVRAEAVNCREILCEEKNYVYDFSPRGIDLNSFPFNNWRKITRNVLVDDNRELFAPGHPQGEPALRETISRYLHQSRGVSCDPENIIIGAGNEYLLMLLAQIIGDDAVYAMENPTYTQAYRILFGLNKKVCAVPLDEYGMDVDKLNKSGATVAYVMPSHQYPLGIVMPVKRRQELLKWAESSQDRYIIEDDYDSEFRYKGKPIPALRGSDTIDRVIYIGTFSKSIAPAIRMSYMVLPQKLYEIYRTKLYFYSCTVSRIDQNVVNDFINGGYYERHLNKMRSLYKSRHDIMISALKVLSDRFEISGENAGLHVLLHSRIKIGEERLILAAKEAGVRVYPLSSCYIDDSYADRNGTVMLGYANMGENEIMNGISLIEKAWR